MHFLRHNLVHVMVRLDVPQEFIRSMGANVNQFLGPSECAVSELCLLVRDVALAALVVAGTAHAHSNEDGRADHCYEPWLWMAQLKDVQPTLCLELVPCDNVGVAGHEVYRCVCYGSRDHSGGDAGGDEGRNGHNHDAAAVLFEEDELAVVLLEEDELAGECLWQSHERWCCLHLPAAAGWRLPLLLFFSGWRWRAK
jgi:hypothetical protein